MQKHSRVYPTEVLTSLIELPSLSKDQLTDQAHVASWTEALGAKLSLISEQSKTHRFVARVFEDVERHLFCP